MIRYIPKPLLPSVTVAHWAVGGLVAVLLLGGPWGLTAPRLVGQNFNSNPQNHDAETSGDLGTDLTLLASLHGPDLLQAVESALTEAITACEQSVVAITRVRNDQAPRGQLDSLRFSPSLQLSNDPTHEDFMPTYFGSGVIISHDGYLVTCAHVLDDPRKHSYYVWLDRRCYSATVVGKPAQVLAADPFSDLAVLKIQASGLKTIPLSTEPLRKGQIVIALGNPNAMARDGQPSANWGIVSNLNRFAPREKDQGPSESIHQMGTLIQTNLRLPPGTSGGALINWRGQLVGITTNLLASPGTEQSAGLAIAADDFFQRIIDVLQQGKQPEFGFLGIQPENLRMAELEQGLTGARVSMVLPGLPGNQAGLREGDIISQVAGTPVKSRNDLFRELSKIPTGTKIPLEVHRMRGGGWQSMSMEAELAKKYLASNRPSYSLHGPPVWRGAQVEYSSAIAGDFERVSMLREGPKVSLLNVTPDSPVWRAGLRAGYGLTSLNGQAIPTPEQFHELANKAIGKVTLTAITTDGKKLSASIEPDAE